MTDVVVMAAAGPPGSGPRLLECISSAFWGKSGGPMSRLRLRERDRKRFPPCKVVDSRSGFVLCEFPDAWRLDDPSVRCARAAAVALATEEKARAIWFGNLAYRNMARERLDPPPLYADDYRLRDVAEPGELLDRYDEQALLSVWRRR